MPLNPRQSILVALTLCTALLVLSQSTASADEFIGPFPSWTNVKTLYGAVGDGKADDTTALQKGLDELGTQGHSNVLYIPAGTYRLTAGLKITSRINVSILGESPSVTTIRWDGPADGTMLYCNGLSYSRLGRITWDGAGKALTAVDHGWDGKVPYANTHGEHADEVFKDVGFGIRGGSHGFMDAECPILRCHFLRCSKAGISIENFNALDWFIWRCDFEDCHFGVTNTYGAGNFHVYDSVFVRSTESDIGMGNCEFFSMRHNNSFNSRRFFEGTGNGCAGLITLQGNLISSTIDPVSIQVGNLGPLLLFDNIILTGPPVKPGPEVSVNTNGDYVSVSNTFDALNSINVIPGRSLSIGDHLVTPRALKLPEYQFPTPLPNEDRKITEIPVNSSAQVIAAAITAAVKLKGQRPVIHLPSGTYTIDRTLEIPAGSDIQLVGDGYTSILKWTGSGTGPVLHLGGPSRATLRDLSISGAGTADGVVVDNCDQTGARVFMEQVDANNGKQYGLLVDGLDHTDVSLHDFYHSGNTLAGVKVVGGPEAARGQKSESRTDIFGGASSGNGISYDVSNNGWLLAEDIWYEGAPPGFVRASGSGAFTLNGATIAASDPNHGGKIGQEAAVEAHDFHGKLTFLTSIFNSTGVVVDGDGASTDLMLMGVIGNGDDYLHNHSPHARAALVESVKYTPGGGAATIPNQGTADPQWVLKMLEQVRTEVPRPIDPLKPGITDLRFYRVSVEGGPVAIWLRGVEPHSSR